MRRHAQLLVIKIKVLILVEPLQRKSAKHTFFILNEGVGLKVFEVLHHKSKNCNDVLNTKLASATPRFESSMQWSQKFVPK